MTANEIIPRLYLGDVGDAIEFTQGPRLCVAEELMPPPYATTDEDEQIQVCRDVPQGFNTRYEANTNQLDRAADWIHEQLTAGRTVLVHCAIGMERSPLVVVWYLRRYGHFTLLDTAYDHVIERRPIVERRFSWLPKSKDFIYSGRKERVDGNGDPY